MKRDPEYYAHEFADGLLEQQNAIAYNRKTSEHILRVLSEDPSE